MKKSMRKFWGILSGGAVALLLLGGAQEAAAGRGPGAASRDAVSQPWRAPFLRNATGAYAGPDMLIPRGRDQDKARQGVDSGNYVPLSTILGNIRRKYPGKHLHTRTTGAPGSKDMHYQVLWLTPDGHRLDITADAKSGRILSVRGQ